MSVISMVWSGHGVIEARERSESDTGTANARVAKATGRREGKPGNSAGDVVAYLNKGVGEGDGGTLGPLSPLPLRFTTGGRSLAASWANARRGATL